MTVSVGLKPELLVLTRIRVLHRVIHELSRGFGVSSSGMEVIDKGVLQQQILSEIWIDYINDNKRIVGQVTMTIDWDKHLVSAVTETGKFFKVEQDCSVAEQISRVYKVIINHTENMRNIFNIKNIETYYVIRHEIRSDTEKLKQARKFLGLSPRTESNEWETDSSVKKEAIKLKYVSNMLNELSIELRHKKPTI